MPPPSAIKKTIYQLPANWTEQVTIGIKTFLRPKCLRNCLRSIRQYYPTIQIMVADDSNSRIKKKNRQLIESMSGVTHFRLPFDVGLSAGRNKIAQQTNTKYLLIVDDDTLFTEDSKIEKMFLFLEETGYQLIGGTSPKSTGYKASFLWTKGKTLYYRKRSYGLVSNGACFAQKTDRTLNYFLVRVKDLQKNLWVRELKVCEHNVFFVHAWQKGWQMAYTPEVVFRQKKFNSDEYKQFRYKRIQNYCQLAERMTFTLQTVNLDRENQYRKKKGNSLSQEMDEKLIYSRKKLDREVMLKSQRKAEVSIQKNIVRTGTKEVLKPIGSNQSSINIRQLTLDLIDAKNHFKKLERKNRQQKLRS